MTCHNWSKNDYIVAYYLYKYQGNENLPYSFEAICNQLSISVNSMKMCLSNYKAIETGIGLQNTSKMQKEVQKHCHLKDKDNLRNKVQSILEQKNQDILKMNIKDELTAICKRHLLPNDIQATIREPYIPYIPKRWNGVLVLAEAQNHGNTSYLNWLNSLSSTEIIQRLYHNPDLGEIGVQPWDNYILKIAVEAALSIKADETAVSNASLWSQVQPNGNNQNPAEVLVECSVCIWKDILKVLEPKQIVTSGAIAKDVIVRAREPIDRWKHIEWKLAGPRLNLVAGYFSEEDLLHRYPEVAKVLIERPEWFLTFRRNKIFFACHAVSMMTNQSD